jgi:hypothetical protein
MRSTKAPLPTSTVIWPAGRARGARAGRPRAIEPGDPVLLVIEDDPHYARILLGWRATRASRAWWPARAPWPVAGAPVPADRDLAGHLPARHAGLDGAEPAEARPGAAAHPGADRHDGEERQHGLSHGAFAYLVKEPTTAGLEAALDRLKEFTVPRTKRLLVVEDNEIERDAVVELLGHDDIEIVTAGRGDEALRAAARASLRLRGAGPAAARHDRLRTAGKAAADPSWPRCRWWCSPART